MTTIKGEMDAERFEALRLKVNEVRGSSFLDPCFLGILILKYLQITRRINTFKDSGLLNLLYVFKIL